MSDDMINHPPHYNHGKFETIKVIEDWGLDYHLGNCVKYISRAAHKGRELEDLKKARFYLDRKIESMEAQLIGGPKAKKCDLCDEPAVWSTSWCKAHQKCAVCGAVGWTVVDHGWIGTCRFCVHAETSKSGWQLKEY